MYSPAYGRLYTATLSFVLQNILSVILSVSSSVIQSLVSLCQLQYIIDIIFLMYNEANFVSFRNKDNINFKCCIIF